ncbi:heme-thiolate peroxidase [Ramaria rubella]|nr:heme-thiolate peroxidase [Ramaria rubella]
MQSHPFVLPEATASRSPCPALNSAASHGFLPHSGRDISFLQLLNAIRTVYNISIPLALFLTSAAFFICGRNGHPTVPFIGTIDLHDLARHGRIEHDGSLAHADAAPGAVFAPTTPDLKVLNALTTQAETQETNLNLEDLARVRRASDMSLESQGRPLDSFHSEITRGEIALILLVMGDGTQVSIQRLKQWMGEDRLPDGWTRPQKTRGLLETIWTARKVKSVISDMDMSGTSDKEE